MKTKDEELKEELDDLIKTNGKEIIDDDGTDVGYADNFIRIGEVEAELKGRQEKEQEMRKDIETARRCLDFRGVVCNNQDCLNPYCPLYLKQKITNQEKKE